MLAFYVFAQVIIDVSNTLKQKDTYIKLRRIETWKRQMRKVSWNFSHDIYRHTNTRKEF